MTYLTAFINNEPLRLRVYGALALLLPVLKAFGVDVTDGQTAALLALAYAVLVGGTEWARSKVSPV